MSTTSNSARKRGKDKRISRAGDVPTAVAGRTKPKTAPRRLEVSQSELARRAGVSKAMVTKYAGRGMPVRADGKVDLAQALEWIKRNAVKERSGNPAVRGENEALADAQARKERANADLRELEVKRKTGELAAIGEINAWISGMIAKARDILLRIGPELRDRLAQEGDPVKCEDLVAAEVNRALRELAEFRVA